MAALDQLVKGAPAGHVDLASARATPEPDPLALLPSSPPQIYLNLLILEASLRSQYLVLRSRRRQYTFFLTLLALWNVYFFYALFLQPREDGRVGGSVYWVIDLAEKLALLGGAITTLLVWGTGQWERGVRWPRRFIGTANRGLRTMNCKIVLLKGTWWREGLHLLACLFPFYAPPVDEELAPGGDYVKLLLLPKSFSLDFRENWDLYRSEYWDKENERRAAQRRRVQAREKQRTADQGWWSWILPPDARRHSLSQSRLSSEGGRRRAGSNRKH